MREAYRLQKNVLEEKLSGDKKSLVIFFIYTGKELPDYATVSERVSVILNKLLKTI